MDALRRMKSPSLVALIAGVVVVLSGVRAKPLLEDAEIDVPDVPDVAEVGCFFRAHNRTYAVGEKWGTGAPFGCMELTCTGSNAISGVSCATFIAGPECVEDPGDQTAVYPYCCPFPRCPSTEAAELNTPKPTDLPWEDVFNNIP